MRGFDLPCGKRQLWQMCFRARPDAPPAKSLSLAKTPGWQQCSFARRVNSLAPVTELGLIQLLVFHQKEAAPLQPDLRSGHQLHCVPNNADVEDSARQSLALALETAMQPCTPRRSGPLCRKPQTEAQEGGQRWQAAVVPL